MNERQRVSISYISMDFYRNRSIRQILVFRIDLSRLSKESYGLHPLQISPSIDVYKRQTVCFIENIDPLGVHTGDSFCSAPMLTIPEHVQKRLQEKSYKIVEAIQMCIRDSGHTV